MELLSGIGTRPVAGKHAERMCTKFCHWTCAIR